MEDVKMSEIGTIPTGTATPTLQNQPLPTFYNNDGVLTSKKQNAGRTQRIQSEPRCHLKELKGSVTRSRVTKFQPLLQGPKMISWTSAHPKELSGLYNPKCRHSYFDQIYLRNHTRKGIEAGEPGLVGCGSFSSVYSVTCKEDGKMYAIKRLDRMLTDRDTKRKKRELENHQLLPSHPNCVQIHSSWQEDLHLYMQIELCLTSLEEYAKDRIIPEATLWEFLIDMLHALQHIHSLGYIHMDIKPANILISEAGVLKLADFGLMIDKAADCDREDGDAIYLAPEVYHDSFTQSADLFSLGITMFELATDSDLAFARNQPPYQQLRENTFPDGIFKEHNISSDMEGIIRWMMRKDPKERPTVEELLDLPRVKSRAWLLALKRAIRGILHPYLHYVLSAFSNVIPARFRTAISYGSGSEGESQLDMTASDISLMTSPPANDTHQSSDVFMDDSAERSFESPELESAARRYALTTGNINRRRGHLTGLDSSPTQTDESSISSPKLSTSQESRYKRKTRQPSEVTPSSARKRINFNEIEESPVEIQHSPVKRNLLSMFDESDED